MKLTAKQAGQELVKSRKVKLQKEIYHLSGLQERFSKLRKNSKDKRKYLNAIELSDAKIERLTESVSEAEIICNHAEEIHSISEQIKELCEKRNNLTPGVVGANVCLQGMMRNGFE